ncbi:MAG: hypothetical protein J0I34_32940 [Pseudonocardia sp.]|uniref:hypothetical protein n=1 Tax=unclassified Pseudonocardia TaxID=2619320 RepID=UPI00086E3FC8|nr:MULTISPECIES: hypothetical protein [unclassified Pseudonocardia]MBN9113574.1 hypothetical protein [Pseudonocardia sp.]ODU29622.1 MAG: hypothetical protein ABS80_01570 [Pseudonocardia sp. SCN 72-51]ODV00463.1 MAG: hypothetical protein ABT15_29285 [Pseudonocardia sp. SCN 73-27]
MDESILRNLDTQHRRLTELEADVARLLAGDTDDLASTTAASPGPVIGVPPARYGDLTTANDTLRAERGWDEIDLDAALTPALREQYARWDDRHRARWTRGDVAAVACAGAIGVLATWFDATIDSVVRDRLKQLADTPLVRRWEREAKRMPIDYTGPRFGGPGHRLRSAGHDIGRPFEALRQIRSGEFRGYSWDYGQRTTHLVGGYAPVASLGEALTLWGKHLVADVVTPMSLPLPGASALYELPVKNLRDFAHQSYDNGLNLRWAALSTLPVITSEVIVRTYVHGAAMLSSGTAVLQPAEAAKRTELRLATHALVGAASLGKALTYALATRSPIRAYRHLNWPVLVTAATTALQVAGDARTRNHAPGRSWDDLLNDIGQPWQLDEAVAVDRSFAS